MATLFFLLNFMFTFSTGSLIFPDHLKTIVGGRESLAPPEDDPVVFVTHENQWARIGGLREGIYPDSYYRFLGLRYAEPPVGKLRFQRPRLVKLFGDHSARKFGAPCPQPHPNDPNRITGSEDCLFLNVFTPKLPDGEPLLPVLVWIHGGGFRRGSAAQYGGGLIARRDIVLVTANYRLGALGFLSAGDQNLPGNAAMFDLAAVLKWVKDNISFFGGDPERIIPFGQGTGGSSAALLALSNVTEGRMAGVISMSGSATSPFAIDSDPQGATKELAEKNGCPLSPVLAMVKCLQQLPVEKLIQADSVVEELRAAARGLSGMAAALSPAPVVEQRRDGRSLPPYLDETPLEALERGHGAKIPLLTGVTSHETAAAVTGGFRSKILDGLANIPNFFDGVLVRDLAQRSVQKVEASAMSVGKVLTAVTSNYKSLKPLSLAENLNQVIEATSDALFNFPAFQLTNAWLKRKLPTFFYTFEHSGKLRGAAKVLRGSSLVFDSDEVNNIEAVSHGSDLPYLFDLRSLEGTPDPEFNESTILSPEDLSARNTFLTILEQFAKKGSININSKLPMFPSYISIGKTASIGANFRECNMALWSGKQPKENCPKLQILTGQILQGLGGIYSSTANKLPSVPKLNLSLPQLKPQLSFPGLG